MEENKKLTEVDEKIEELLNDPSIKTEEEKEFLKQVGEKLKNGEMPVDLILGKTNQAKQSLEEIKNKHPEFESFVKHYQNKIDESVTQMMELLKSAN